MQAFNGVLGFFMGALFSGLAGRKYHSRTSISTACRRAGGIENVHFLPVIFGPVA